MLTTEMLAQITAARRESFRRVPVAVGCSTEQMLQQVCQVQTLLDDDVYVHTDEVMLLLDTIALALERRLREEEA